VNAIRIEPLSQVTFTYQIRDQGGELLEASDLPMNYVQGQDGGLLEALEAALMGHAAGETVTITLAPEQAYGPHDPELTYTDDIENVPPEYHYVGAEVQFQNDDGEVKTFTVSRIENGRLTVDANHAYAGKTLTFTLNIIDVREAASDGHTH
jgi:FKBP-type peptidyl-prolyl cis-trans isomerase SlyD